MRVLDLGSGAGDVALLVAQMVGCTGSVVGIDRDPVILQTARDRARAHGMTHISFVEGNLEQTQIEVSSTRWWVGWFSSTHPTRVASCVM